MTSLARMGGAAVAALLTGCVIMIATTSAAGGNQPAGKPGPLDPQGRIHIPIGIADSLDSLKTFVEAEGGFSPGVGSFGVYFWLYDPPGGRERAGGLVAATMPTVACEHGLSEEGWPIPWTRWSAGEVQVRSELCQVEVRSGSPGGGAGGRQSAGGRGGERPVGDVAVGEQVVAGGPSGSGASGQVLAARVTLTNKGKAEARVHLYAALRGLGPAGGDVKDLAVSESGDALLVDGQTALVSLDKPASAGVAGTDTIGELALAGRMPDGRRVTSAKGDCSGALRLEVALAAGQSRTLRFVCPVLAGRRAVAHEWDGTSGWAQLDLARPNPAEGGELQSDLGLAFYRKLDVDSLFEQARRYWADLAGRAKLSLPDARWPAALAAITAHAALTMNRGAPDVAVVNYNVFNRDGVYIASILQKAGRCDLAAAAIDYFLTHPFNGRVRVEADNPGQVLWAIGQHWLFSRDEVWLRRVYPSAARLAAMIRYHRTTPPPHYVKANSLALGDDLPPDRPDEKLADRRQVLKPGSCDGHHPEYTEAFDIAGLRAAALLAKAIGNAADATAFAALADRLGESYDQTFGAKLPAGYGSYCVLWPCRLYPLAAGKAREQFKSVGVQRPGGWRYFALARAHQGLLAGNRQAGWATVNAHLDHPQMRGFYAFDEGGRSGPGGWAHLRTTWPHGTAMPHGWAIAELHLLIRDCLVHEDSGYLVLLAGVPPEWFTDARGMGVEGLPTHFGRLTFRYRPPAGGGDAELTLAADARPPDGFDLRLPEISGVTVVLDGKPASRTPAGGYLLPAGTTHVHIRISGR